ncbi:MAG: ribonuclease H-like domain-containing protein [Dehalococcoidia bacterium]|nr:ribonuclease H-like domain-containing protein [Dehalococcoidia bacterium]MDP6783341.1 ribonuclease H-like domain-containing protein [Dehalococcoidia bacterium]
MQPGLEAYLDIETTGLSPRDCQITVIGIYLCQGGGSRLVHLVGEDITTDSLLQVLEGVGVIYTYNGTRFDLPFIHRLLGVDLAQLFQHCDLMYHCWQSNLYGGLKAVERQLGIKRKLLDINGYEAVRLWLRYVNDYNQKALATLLEYNKEDVLNLKTLRERLL